MKVSAGFSLVELMVVIMVASILMAVGVPSYRYVTNSNRLSAEVNALLGDLQFARSEAIKEGQTVTVCPSIDQATCAAGSTTWHTGWIVLANTGNPPVATVLRVQQQFASAKDTFAAAQNVTSISFNREGFAAGQPTPAAGFVMINLTTLPDAPQWRRCVEVGLGGSLTTERPGQGNCN
jgi:type IV fimbrial biogenesis protein FimT